LIIRIANKRGLNKQLLFLIGRIAKICLIVFGLITSLGTFGINISVLVAGLGLTGFTLGFALKDVVSNLIAGSFILLHRPFKINDKISINKHCWSRGESYQD
jgi:small-conductance mechanosensitive channel